MSKKKPVEFRLGTRVKLKKDFGKHEVCRRQANNGEDLYHSDWRRHTGTIVNMNCENMNCENMNNAVQTSNIVWQGWQEQFVHWDGMSRPCQVRVECLEQV